MSLVSRISALATAIATEVKKKATIDSPTFTGTPAAPTQATSDNSTRIATTAWVRAFFSSLGSIATLLRPPAGTTAANTAPIKLTAGPLNTTPETGAVEHDGYNLFFTPGSTRKAVAYEDGSTLFYAVPCFTPNSNQTLTVNSDGVTMTLTNPVSYKQFENGMVGAKIIVNGEDRIIQSVTNSGAAYVVTSRPFPNAMKGQTYDNTKFRIYGKAFEVGSDGYPTVWSGAQSGGAPAASKIFGFSGGYLTNTYGFMIDGNGLWTGGGLDIKNSAHLRWGVSGNYWADDSDVSLRRNSAGVLEIIDGTRGASTNYRDLILRLINANQIQLRVADGTTPMIVTSKTVVANLNADLLDGKHASDFAQIGIDASQTAHGFAVGDAIKRAVGGWVKVKADTLANAGVAAFVYSVTDANNFKYITGGFLPGTYTDGADYYSSTTTNGGVMTLGSPETWTAGQVRQYVGTGVPGGLMVDIDAGDLIQTSPFNDVYVSGMSFNNTTRTLTLTRTGGMADLNLAIPYPPEDMAYEFRDINKGVAQTYVLDMKASWPYTIQSIVLESDGSLSGVSVKIGTTAVTGMSSLTVGAIAETNASGANSVVAGNAVTINTTSSYSGTPTWLRVKLKIQRT